MRCYKKIRISADIIVKDFISFIKIFGLYGKYVSALKKHEEECINRNVLMFYDAPPNLGNFNRASINVLANRLIYYSGRDYIGRIDVYRSFFCLDNFRPIIPELESRNLFFKNTKKITMLDLFEDYLVEKKHYKCMLLKGNYIPVDTKG